MHHSLFILTRLLSTAAMLAVFSGGHAVAQNYKPLPPPGIELDAEVREALSKRVDRLHRRIAAAAESSPDAEAWVPDVEVLVRAVDLALQQNLFFKESEIPHADLLLAEAERRLKEVAAGKRGLALLGLAKKVSDQPTLVVGGFRSRIDDSVQPYGLVIPAGYRQNAGKARLDVWLHGRGDTKTEIPFLRERMTKRGEYAPKDTFVLHPFGRHCVAFKFAGETDVYEAIEHVSKLVPVDSDRLAMRGFSMGGAGVWHLAVHDPTRWFAANPGAGFVDTLVYQGWTEKPPFELTETRRKLLHWYDVIPWVTNLRNTNLVAYSGEVDKQRQAAERVTAAAKEAGIDHQHIIGKDMGHKIDPPSAEKIDGILAQIAQRDRQSPRRKIDFVTYLLRYHRADWLSVEGLEAQFQPGRVVAEIVGDHTIGLSTQGVTRLRLNFADSGWPGDGATVMLEINGQRLEVADRGKAPGLQCEVFLQDDWRVEESFEKTLRKRPGMQGPIDDAFCDRFVFVVPSRPATHGVVQRWIDREMKYAADRWKTLMRGEVQWVADTEVTEEMIRSSHLVCFGDFASNRYLAGIASQLPIAWSKDQLAVGGATFDPATHVPAFCFPNPKNPDRYVVINSGMTFREFSNVSNSRQIAMLPDWAVLNVSGKDDGIFAGDVVADGFFDEAWRLGHDDTANGP